MAVSSPGVSGPYPQSTKGKRTLAQWGIIAAGCMCIVGIIFVGIRIASDLSGVHNSSAWPFALLALALIIALGFEFVNGFHDTANAVATVIYTHSLEPHFAVLWRSEERRVGKEC